MIFSVLFPKECVLCENIFIFNNQNYICENCLNKLIQTDFNYCKSCGKLTKHCKECEIEPKYDEIRVFTRVNRDITTLISIYKLYPVKVLGKELSKRINKDIKQFVEDKKIDLITYIPIYKDLQKKRGFNHLKEILRHIFDKKILKEVLIKTRNTKLQMDLSADERKKNLQNAFILKNFKDVEDKNILVFDDILTTGSTLLEVLKTLKKGKPRNVYAYVIAR